MFREDLCNSGLGNYNLDLDLYQKNNHEAVIANLKKNQSDCHVKEDLNGWCYDLGFANNHEIKKQEGF